MERRWTGDDVLGLARAYQAGCVLAAAAELDVFDTLNTRQLTATALAAELDADVRGTAVLANALTAMGFLRKNDGVYSVPADVAALLTEEGTDRVLSMVRHHANCLRRWSQLAHVVNSGKPAERVSSIRGNAADRAAFVDAMHDVSRSVAPGLVEGLMPLAFRHLLDVGGATGTWTIAFLRAVPGARATLFDLPDAIPMARERIAKARLANRVSLVAGDFYTDPLPSGADFVLCSAIAHQNSREQNRALFVKMHAALCDGGQVLIRDVIMDESRTQPEAGALFAINMLVATEAGGTYTFDEFREDLGHAGFGGVTLLRKDDGMNSLVRATKQ